VSSILFKAFSFTLIFHKNQGISIVFEYLCSYSITIKPNVSFALITHSDLYSDALDVSRAFPFVTGHVNTSPDCERSVEHAREHAQRYVNITGTDEHRNSRSRRRPRAGIVAGVQRARKAAQSDRRSLV